MSYQKTWRDEFAEANLTLMRISKKDWPRPEANLEISGVFIRKQDVKIASHESRICKTNLANV